MEVNIDGAVYKSSRLDTVSQFHVARRLTPALPGLMLQVKDADLSKLDSSAILMIVAGPVGQAFAFMPQEDADYIIRTCLSVWSKIEGDKAAPLMVNGKMMYSDMKLPTMIKLVVETVKAHLADFLPVEGSGA